MWRLCCGNCQVDEIDRRESGHVKATTNNIDGMFISMHFSTCTICSYVLLKM
jgi:hypothetical protein